MSAAYCRHGMSGPHHPMDEEVCPGPHTGICSVCERPARTGDGHGHPRPWYILCPSGHRTTYVTATGVRRCKEGHEVL